MTAIDDAVSSIQQLQNDLANIVTFLQAYQLGQSNGMNIDKVSLKITITNLMTKVSNDINTAKTNLQTAIGSL